ncbi:Uncharacterised protein [Klebsiella pneumoniae]|nr:Uncharacterised protein [Klebsiella variicola]SYL24353.1 Uncharacterised protein [Klebsiella pneumoniae]
MFFSQTPYCCFFLSQQFEYFFFFHKVCRSHKHLIQNYRYKYTCHTHREPLQYKHHSGLLFYEVVL